MAEKSLQLLKIFGDDVPVKTKPPEEIPSTEEDKGEDRPKDKKQKKVKMEAK